MRLAKDAEAFFSKKSQLDQFWVSSLGFASWIIIIGYRLFSVPTSWWRWRDDAVITLSHAQNLVNFGTIGISPGDRVEGFSAPLQFLLSSFFFWITGQGYGLFLDLQVFLCIGLAGALIAITSYKILTSMRTPVAHSGQILIPVLISCLASLITAASWTSIGWLASGMENPLAVVIGLIIIYISSLPPERKHLISASVLVGFLGIVRVEFAAFALPLCASVAAVFSSKLGFNYLKYFAIAFAIPVSMWAVIHFLRLIYFGSLLPNTALVQGKESNFLLKLLILIIFYFLYALACLGLSKLPKNKLLRMWRFLAYASIISPVLLISYVYHFNKLFLFPYCLGFLMLVSLISFLQYLRLRIAEFDLSQTLLFFGLLFIPVAQIAVMGEARMEWSRVLSIATPWMAAWIALSLTTLISYEGRLNLLFRNKVESLLVLLSASLGLLISSQLDSPRDMPWIISPREQQILHASNIHEKKMLNSEVLMLVANPDLGKLSFEKRLMITDLGWLGDPLLGLINKNARHHQSRYLNEVAKPDIVQAHRTWSCKYSDWIYSNSFQSSYELVLGQKNLDTPCPNNGESSIWRRSPNSEAAKEYALTDKIVSDKDPIVSIKLALSQCLSSGKNPFRCVFVARSIRRGYLRLKRDGLLQNALDELKESPSYSLDYQMIAKGPGWSKKAYEHFIELLKH